MWAIALYQFRLTHDQFLELTPVQFSALSKQHELRTFQEDLRPAIIASTIVNLFAKEPMSPTAFMPSYASKEEKKEEELSGEELRRALEKLYPRTEANG